MKMLNRPILSVVVPTKDRHDTLNILIHSLLQWDSDDFELIIQDNSANNSVTKSFLESFKNDGRLRYYHDPTPYSAVENCDLAVKKISGYYACFIGDDDGLLHQIIDVCRWMYTNKIDALCCKSGLYTWPDMQHAVSLNNKYNGILLEQAIEGTFKKLDAEAELIKVVASGAQSMYNIPRLYQGIVSKEVLDLLYNEIGSYFPGPVPDMANAIAINKYIHEFYYTDIPFIVSGQSRNSMSGKNSVRAHQGDIKMEKTLPSNSFDEWSPLIPKYWSAPTIWSEAALKAAFLTKQEYVITYLNYAKIYASCFAFSDKKYYPLIFQSMFFEKSKAEKIFILTKCLYYFFQVWILRASIFFGKLIFGIKGKNFITIEHALKYLEKTIQEHDYIKKQGFQYK